MTPHEDSRQLIEYSEPYTIEQDRVCDGMQTPDCGCVCRVWTCTRESGHVGRHGAHGQKGHLYAEWD